MDYKAIQELIKTVSESNLTHVELETEGMRIRLEKKQEVVSMERIPEVVKTVAATQAVIPQVQLVQEMPKVQETAAAEPEKKEGILVTSPIVGTYYDAPSPDAEAFVTVGSKVKKGQVLCIIEAMKLMNEIESEVDGEVVEILVKREQMVEYSQPLFRIVEA